MQDETQLDVLRDIRELLQLIAEPQLAIRDKARRDALRKVIGKSDKNLNSVLLMDGSRKQATIAKEVPIDIGQLSKLVKSLSEAKLLTPSVNPTLVIPVSSSILTEDKP